MPDASPVVPVVPAANPASAAPAAEAPKAPAAAPVVPAGGAQPNAQPAAAQPGEVKYDLKLPENHVLGDGAVERIASYAKEKGLSQEQAQSLLERENGAAQSYASRQMEQYNKTVDSWAKMVETDTEIGGQNFKQNIELASQVVKRYGSESLVKALKDTGYGNHPELVRVFARIGKAMSPDQLVLPGSQPAGKKAIEDVFYGGSKQPQ
jgi:hypothetical protein